jgi:signal transduction histidine kinase/ligand-binding sensor domain-containing protein
VRIFRILFLCLLAVRVCAAAPAAGSGVVVRVWQSQDGLPSNVVRSVVQSSDGYLWVATAEGVARFDGFEFELIEPDSELRRYRLAFSRLFATSGGDVWAATYQGGLFRVRNERLELILENIRSPRPPLVTQLVRDAAGSVFFKRGPETGRIADDGSVAAVMPTAELEGLFEKDLKHQSESGRTTESGVDPVLRDRAGRVWSAGASSGLTISEEGRSPVTVDFPQRGHAFVINEMMLDREGNVWVASPLNGLARVRHARVDLPDIDKSSGDRSFSSLLEDRSGVWWIANRRGGLLRWTPEESRHIEFSTSRFFRPAAALFEDRDSRLWVGSRDGSVFLQENGAFLPQFVKTQIPSKVRSITQDAEGTMWFGGAQGLASYSGGQVRKYGKADGVGQMEVTVLQPYPGGGIIAGGLNGTVLLGNGRGFNTVAAPEVMNHQEISGILPVTAKEVWVSTLGSGLFLWNGKSWKGFGENDGLPDARLTCVLEDGRDNLWLGSLGGIVRVERKELLARARDPEVAVHWLLLDHTDGMPSRECIGGFQPAGWKARDGQLWFPTGGGIVRVRPDLVERNKLPPPVYLQSARVNGVQHPGGSGPVVSEPGRARLEFRFIGLGFSAPEKTTYRARLTGLGDSWRELGNQRVAAFEAVPPGRYTFEVMAVNGDGIRSPEPARVSVIVKPHLWETVWFYLIAGAVVLSAAAGVGWFAARQRMKARIQELKIRNAREAERSRIARDLHDDLGASLTEISILAALAAEDAEKTPLQPSLDQLSNKAKHVVSGLDEIVWAVNPREDTLRSLVDYLAAFAREFLDIARIPLRVDITGEIPDFPMATTQRHGVFLAAREALNNIAKHSGATGVTLHTFIADDVLEIRIEDNGCGFEPDYATGGNGLGNLRTRMQEAGGDCRIETRRRQGTTVFLTLPLQPSAKPVS